MTLDLFHYKSYMTYWTYFTYYDGDTQLVPRPIVNGCRDLPHQAMLLVAPQRKGL